jgi:hypothetical protein
VTPNKFGERFELLLDQIARGVVPQLATFVIEFGGAAADEDFRLVQCQRI